ncbi:DUF3311 domain-containing protein [Paraburkholderia sp. J8-2]|uniref:DUF3311 domain-containing protein n=1 Tax=Paraburkholderia sp. J8-2 TaxID=2805440 RepID=UPI002AB5DF86|nr:DUF3311 domain-containing protein [Paraburkholderia sp. J8-2]
MKGKPGSLRRRLSLLYIPWLALIAIPTYDRIDPMWDGMPFFYWYQLFWLLGGCVITGIVFLASDAVASNETSTPAPDSAAESPMDAPPPLFAEFHFEAFEGEADL